MHSIHAMGEIQIQKSIQTIDKIYYIVTKYLRVLRLTYKTLKHEYETHYNIIIVEVNQTSLSAMFASRYCLLSNTERMHYNILIPPKLYRNTRISIVRCSRLEKSIINSLTRYYNIDRQRVLYVILKVLYFFIYYYTECPIV